MTDKRVILDVSFRSASGRSLQDSRTGISGSEAGDFGASDETVQEAVQALRTLGFETIGPSTAFGVTIAGSLEAVRAAFGADQLVVPESLAQWIESVRIPPAAKFFGDA